MKATESVRWPVLPSELADKQPLRTTLVYLRRFPSERTASHLKVCGAGMHGPVPYCIAFRRWNLSGVPSGDARVPPVGQVRSLRQALGSIQALSPAQLPLRGLSPLHMMCRPRPHAEIAREPERALRRIAAVPLQILVTGGAGYLGCVLVPYLLQQGHEVCVLDKFLYGGSGLLECCADPRFHPIRGDCREESVLQQALAGCDVIIPLAAIVGAPACDADPFAARSTNLDAIRLLLRLRGRSQSIIFPTTNSGYGIGEQGKYCTETTPLRPISLYGRTKVDAEQAVLDAGNAVTLRLATVFGMSPRMRLDLLVNDFVYRAVTDRAVTVFEGHAKRNYIHVRDVARAFVHVMENFSRMNGEPYNVGLSDANLSKLELCAAIQRKLPRFVYLEAPVGEDPDKRDYIVSNAKIEATGFRPRYSLEMGIEELIKGYTILRRHQYSNLN